VTGTSTFSLCVRIAVLNATTLLTERAGLPDRWATQQAQPPASLLTATAPPKQPRRKCLLWVLAEAAIVEHGAVDFIVAAVPPPVGCKAAGSAGLAIGVLQCRHY